MFEWVQSSIRKIKIKTKYLKQTASGPNLLVLIKQKESIFLIYHLSRNVSKQICLCFCSGRVLLIQTVTLSWNLL